MERLTVSLLEVVRRALADLEWCGADAALVGGLAIGARVLERTTRDVDFAVAAADDPAAERVVRALSARGYGIALMLEQVAVDRLATVRCTSPLDGATMVDVLFASSGIEPEVVAAAEPLDIGLGVRCRVARVGHLIALKVLARTERRPQDDQDLQALIGAADPEELALASAAVGSIQSRGYARGKDLAAELEQQLRRFGVVGP
ncbi:MAG: hypothetical protein A2138_11990 [Deltaproteobacteria bacterium RBG_16_71_12]|nr:MAG: hypothetical protein A2138_11990 [Deltaproteobacteria bacterium RBG_16_71_12]